MSNAKELRDLYKPQTKFMVEISFESADEVLKAAEYLESYESCEDAWAYELAEIFKS